MISEESLENEERRNDAENSALHHKIRLHFKYMFNVIFHNILLYFNIK